MVDKVPSLVLISCDKLVVESKVTSFVDVKIEPGDKCVFPVKDSVDNCSVGLISD